jgi:acyl dehydratase
MSESPDEVVEQRGLWFEELRTGVIYKHSPGRTIGEADNTLFSTLTMNPQSLHLDAAFSAATEFGERLVNSLLTMSVLVGLSVGHLTQGTIVANLGFRDARFPAPVLIGDTIYGETVVTEKRRPWPPPTPSSSTWRTGSARKARTRRGPRLSPPTSTPRGSSSGSTRRGPPSTRRTSRHCGRPGTG